MLRDTPGFYTYAIFERLEGWPLVYIENLRIVFKLQQDMYESKTSHHLLKILSISPSPKPPKLNFYCTKLMLYA